MLFLKMFFVVCFMLSVLLSVRCETKETDEDNHKIKGPVVPRFMLRKYTEWSKSSGNYTYLYHSLPVKLFNIEEDSCFGIAQPRTLKSPIISVQLRMEFPNITSRKQIRHKKYFVDITPVFRTEVVASECYLETFSSKAYFPDGILEMEFDITSMYRTCHTKQQHGSFMFMLNFFSLSIRTDIDFTKDKVYMFIITKEHDTYDDIMEVLRNSKNFKPLNYKSIMSEMSPEPDSCWSEYEKTLVRIDNCRTKGECEPDVFEHLTSVSYDEIKAIVKSMYESMRKQSCTVKDLAPLAMLGNDKRGRFTLKSQKEMVATSCECA